MSTLGSFRSTGNKRWPLSCPGEANRGTLGVGEAIERDKAAKTGALKAVRGKPQGVGRSLAMEAASQSESSLSLTIWDIGELI